MSVRRLLVTGNSAGLGLGFTRLLLGRGWEVYGLSRSGCPEQHQSLYDGICDLAAAEQISPCLTRLLADVASLDLVILNAGVLGRIEKMQDLPLEHVREVMDINVWSNKLIFDFLLKSEIDIGQIVVISSGAAVNGNLGWGPYSLSKATLNMLTRLYAAEFPDTHVAALAPGLVDTAMQDFLCDQAQVPVEQYPSVQKLRDARGSDSMPEPEEAARRICAALPRIKEMESGVFVDIRRL